MAEIIGGGTPVNDAERLVIAHLRDHGPADWLVLHNIEVPSRDGAFDIDVVVVTGHAVWLVDVKGTRGRIDVSGSRWYPAGRPAFGSPVGKLRSHARAFKGALQDRRPELNRVYVGALVVLTAPDARLVDPDGRDRDDVVGVDELVGALGDPGRVRAGFGTDIRRHHTAVVEAMNGAARRPAGPPRFGHWTVRERLGGDDSVTEYRAVNEAAGGAGRPVRLRVYRVDSMLPAEQRTLEQRHIANAYDALSRIPPHPCIVRCLDFFGIDDESRFVLVLDEVRGQALQLFLDGGPAELSMDAKLRVVRDMLRGLAHAHAHRVVHRAVGPAVVLATDAGQAVLDGFDYARPDGTREVSVAARLADVLDERYVAPECQARREAMSTASDVYAAGVVAYHLLTGELPFASSTDQYEQGSRLPAAPMAAAGLPPLLADLLRLMCARAPSERPEAAEALLRMQRLLGHGGGPPQPSRSGRAGQGEDPLEPDYRNLPEDFPLTAKYTVRRRLGKPGTFGVAYQVYDDLAGRDRVVKIILRDRESVVERLKKEYRILTDLPPHPNVVRVIDADYLNATKIPFIAFEYVEGRHVGELVEERLLGPADTVGLGMDIAEGLAYLHDNGVYHCDVKPTNLLWTDADGKIIDFNVAVTADSSLSQAGGTPRYAPPDIDTRIRPEIVDLVDRDVYALGITLYQVLTGAYPWDTAAPPPGRLPRNPRDFDGLSDLSDTFVSALSRAIAPRRSERYPTARDFLAALSQARGQVRTPPPPPLPLPVRMSGTNPFVSHLRTLYSQSTASNIGTRGKDAYRLYVHTALDARLRPDVLAGRHRLVIITGNAGDGKTAFLEDLVDAAAEKGAKLGRPRSNGVDFHLGGTWFHTNHDGSQDEGETSGDDVLLDFFAPFAGPRPAPPAGEVRLLAINEGRLVDFLTTHAKRFEHLADVVRAGLRDEPVEVGTAVVDLKHRSVVADMDDTGESIFDRVLVQMTRAELWEDCRGCALADVCYARHNAQTFAHPSPTLGARVRRRLRTLYTLAELRGRLHITMRDLRSALAFMLTSGRDCGEIHALYEAGDRAKILDSLYFNSWAGAAGAADRMLALLRTVDVAPVADPGLDRKLDYVGPDSAAALLDVDGRGTHDRTLLQAEFDALPRTAAPNAEQIQAHTRYLASARRRVYFESVDDERSAAMLPYASAEQFGSALGIPDAVAALLPDLVTAINRSEGVEASQLGDVLALRVRDVPGGTIRSYRLFPAEKLSVEPAGAPRSEYLEGGPNELALVYRDSVREVRMAIRLDLFELLRRLHDGYLPSAAEQQGLYLGLTIFKNELSAAPYQEVLLTANGRDLRRIRRESDGRLVMETALAGVRT